jgi:hypothetical protein
MVATASGLTIPGNDPGTTNVTPLQDIFNNLGKSANGKLIVPVATATAAASLITALAGEGFTPSTSQPVFVERADAPAHAKVEMTVDGTTWTPLLMGDTGWTQTGLVAGSGWAFAASGTWAALAYRVIGGVCYVNGTATKSSWAGNETLATLPVGARPRAQFQTHDVRVQSTGAIAPAGSGTTVFGVDIRFPVG